MPSIAHPVCHRDGVRRLLRITTAPTRTPLPEGTVPVGISLLVAGVATYAFLKVGTPVLVIMWIELSFLLTWQYQL